MKAFMVIQLVAFLPYILVSPAQAYIDPATGSMVIQAVIAVVAAVSVSIGIFWRRLKSFVGRLFGRQHDGDDTNAG